MITDEEIAELERLARVEIEDCHEIFGGDVLPSTILFENSVLSLIERLRAAEKEIDNYRAHIFALTMLRESEGQEAFMKFVNSAIAEQESNHE